MVKADPVELIFGDVLTGEIAATVEPLRVIDATDDILQKAIFAVQLFIVTISVVTELQNTTQIVNDPRTLVDQAADTAGLIAGLLMGGPLHCV